MQASVPGVGGAMDRMNERVPFDDEGFGDGWVVRALDHVGEQLRAGTTPLEWVTDERTVETDKKPEAG